METSLHQQLKRHYAGESGVMEVRVGRYRIDVVRDGLLIEVQHGGLAAIRDKVARLAETHNVLVVKPIVATKWIVKYAKPGGKIVTRRRSPKRGTQLDVFDELVHFTRTLACKRVALEVPLIEVEEHRIPGHGRRRRWRKTDHVVADQHLLGVVSVERYKSPRELLRLLPSDLPTPFDTAELAARLGVGRWIVQRMMYVLRHTGVVVEAGKRGNARLYKLPTRRRRPAA